MEAASRVAQSLDVPVSQIDIHEFPDGELLVTTQPASSTTILFASLNRPNKKLLALLFAADSLRRSGANRLVLVAPYLCYMRQDTAFHAGEAISQKVVGQLIARSFDRVITVDAHLHRTHDITRVFPNIEARNLSAIPAVEQWLRHSEIAHDTVIAGPDTESEQWVKALASRLGATYAVGQKLRHGDKSVAVSFDSHISVEGRNVVLIDDIVSTGATLKACAKALKVAGANFIDAIVIHALFPPEAIMELKDSGIRSIVSTDSVPHLTNRIFLTDLIADALAEERHHKGPSRESP